jgi:hypothetical protein
LDQLRAICEELEPRRFVERHRRRAEDRFREEHHDAHAKTIEAASRKRAVRLDVTSTGVASRNTSPPQEVWNSSLRLRRLVRIRIIKTPPALVMDGFDVRGMRAGHIYPVDGRMAYYLIIAGYALSADGESEPTRAPNR